MSNVRQIAFDSIERLNKLATTDAILSEMQRSCMSFGVENFCISGLPLPYEKLHPYILLSGWPEQWLTRYADNGYVHTDPVIKFLRRADMPFAWSEAPYNRSDKGEARVMNEATEFGLVEGLAIPIYAVNGFQAVVTFGARRLDLDKQRRAALHLIAIYAHGRIREFLRKTNGEKESGPRRPTFRTGSIKDQSGRNRSRVRQRWFWWANPASPSPFSYAR